MSEQMLVCYLTFPVTISIIQYVLFSDCGYLVPHNILHTRWRIFLTSLCIYIFHLCPLSFHRLWLAPYAAIKCEEDKLGRNAGGIDSMSQCGNLVHHNLMGNIYLWVFQGDWCMMSAQLPPRISQMTVCLKMPYKYSFGLCSMLKSDDVCTCIRI